MKQTLCMVLCFVLFHTVLAADAFAIAPNYATPSPLSRQETKVSQAVMRLGAGPDALVALRLRDKTLVKGQIAAVEPRSFLVSDNQTGAEQRVAYAQVARLQGVNLASGVQVQVGGGFKARLSRVASRLLPVSQVQKNSLTNGEKTLLIGVVIGVLIAIILAKAL